MLSCDDSAAITIKLLDSSMNLFFKSLGIDSTVKLFDPLSESLMIMC